MKRKRGFTLIELLVVIAIIGILASVVLASVSSAMSKSRDAQRLSDAREMTKAILFYFSVNGAYPASGGATAPNGSWSNSGDTSWTTLSNILTPYYIPKLPKDPQQSSNTGIWGGNGYSYSYIKCARSFMLVYHLENAKDPDPGMVCNGTTYRYGGAGANTTIKTTGDVY